MEEIRARISFKTGLFLAMLGFLFALVGAAAAIILGVPGVSDLLVEMALADEVRRAFFLSGSIAGVVIGLLLFYIGFDKIRQKQFMEVLRRDVERPAPSSEPYREPPPY